MNFLIEIEVACPYCGETYPLVIDSSQGSHSLIEDCTVCCRPIQLEINCESGELLSVTASPG